jgi:hypothetical protein
MGTRTDKLEFPVFDSDNPKYDTRDVFNRHFPEPFRDAIKYIEIDGRTRIVIRGVVSDDDPIPTFDVVAWPGALEKYSRSGDPEGKSSRDLMGDPMKAISSFRQPGSRLVKMDDLGVDRALRFPTLASLLEERTRDEPGSDWPPPEGLAEPGNFIAHHPDGLSDNEVAQIMGGNLARVMRIEDRVAA